VTDSKGLYDDMTRHEPPQLKLRSARGGEALGAARQQLRASSGAMAWVNGLAMLADCLSKMGARTQFEVFLQNHRWQCKYDEKFESGKRRKARGAATHKDEESEEEELTDELKTLLCDEGMSEDLKKVIMDKYGISG
jgi:hypothetical protein